MFEGFRLWFREFKWCRRVAAAEHEIDARGKDDTVARARRHPIDRQVVVSLTSYPKRFETLALTLKSILFQSVRPDATVLWIAHDDIESLPAAVRDLERYGLTIRACDDMRAYTKIVPTISAYRDSLIVTADDDVYYWSTWLEELLACYQQTENPVICHRAHLIKTGPDRSPQPYGEWQHSLRHRIQSDLVFPTGVMGVLYDTRIFHPDVCNRALFARLSPYNDDIWLYWMHRLRGSRPLTLGLSKRLIEWPGSQMQQLRSINVDQGGNDVAIEEMIRHYGFPEVSPASGE